MTLFWTLFVGYVALSLFCSLVLFAACAVAKQAAQYGRVKRITGRTGEYRASSLYQPLPNPR